MNKAEFIAEVKRTRAEFDDLLGRVDPVLMLEPWPGSSWTIKDIVAHVTWHEREMIDLIEQRALRGSPLWQLPLDERNEAINAENDRLGVDHVLAEHRATLPRLLAALESLSEDELARPIFFAHMPDEWSPAEVIASNTFEHYPDHSVELRAWLAANE